MTTVRRASPVVILVLLVSAIAASAIYASQQVTTTATRLHTSNTTHLVGTLADFLDASVARAASHLLAFDATAPRWSGAPDDARDAAALHEFLGPDQAVTLSDVSGRRLVAVGDSDLLPPSPVDARVASLIEEHGFAVTAHGPQDQRVAEIHLRASSNPNVIINWYIADSAGIDPYLVHFAGESGADYIVVDETGTVRWASDPARLDEHVPISNDEADSSVARVEVDGVEVAVLQRPVPTARATLIFEQDFRSFSGNIETRGQQMVLAITLLLTVFAVAFALIIRRRNQSVRRSRNRLEQLVANVSDAVVVLRGSVVSYASPSVEKLLAVPSHEAIDREISDLLGVDGAAALGRMMAASEGHDRPIRGDVPCQTATGRTIWVEGTVSDRREDDSIKGTVVSLHDITERRAAAEQHLHAATHDALTGIANRAKMKDTTTMLLSRCRRGGSPFALLCLDLDGFKEVNDVFGHAAGDRVLQEVAQRLNSGLRETELAARTGGDEFLVLVEAPDHAHVRTIAQRLITAINHPILVDDVTIEIGVSIGVAFGGSETESYDALVGEGDLAMYAAKRSGKNRVHVAGGELIPDAVKA